MLKRRRARAWTQHGCGFEIGAHRHESAVSSHEKTVAANEKYSAAEVIAEVELSEFFPGFHRPDDRRKQVCGRQHRPTLVEHEIAGWCV
jgi:hypothetical protein